jgi:5-methylcytosine-specific restriction endonuclease McrA
MRRVLKLNADYTPLDIVGWDDALSLIWEGKAVSVVDSETIVHSPSQEFVVPSVIALLQYVRQPYKLSPSRENVLARDYYTCQYCGCEHSSRELTLDHVVPQSRAINRRVFHSGRWVDVGAWENLVAACRGCNQLKGSKLLPQSGLHLRSYPQEPSRAEAIWIRLGRHVEDVWRDYLPTRYSG